MSGPGYVYPTDNLYTWDADGYTKIQTTGKTPADLKPKSLIDVVRDKCKEGGEGQIAFKVKRDEKWISWSWAAYYRDIQTVTKAFIKLGLEERHTVAVQGFNSPEWFLSCQGAVHAGGIVSILHYFISNIADLEKIGVLVFALF